MADPPRDTDPARHEAAHAVGAVIPSLGCRLRLVTVEPDIARAGCAGATLHDGPSQPWAKAAILWLPVIVDGMAGARTDWEQLIRLSTENVARGHAIAAEIAFIYGDVIELVADRLRAEGTLRRSDVEQAVLEIERARNAQIAQLIGARR